MAGLCPAISPKRIRDEQALSLRALPGSARNLRTMQTDIPQRAIVEIRQLSNGGAITRPGSKRGNKRCNPHDSFSFSDKKIGRVAESIFGVRGVLKVQG